MGCRLIFNPVAGNGKAERVFKVIRPLLEAKAVEVVRTRHPGHATELAREVAHDRTMSVISLGGDGTHHEVVNGLLPEGQAVFSVIPAGTGNDFVRILRYPAALLDQAQVALSGPAYPFDVGRIGPRYFLTVAGAGFDAEVAGWVNRRSKRGNGTLVFVRGILYNLLRFRSQPMSLRSPEESHQDLTFMVAVGNTRCYAGGMKICPDADPQDGMLSVVWIRGITPLGVLPLLARVFRGTHVHRPQVHSFRTAQLLIEGPDHLWVHADGELVGHLPVTVECVPAALRIRVGADWLPSVAAPLLSEGEGTSFV